MIKIDSFSIDNYIVRIYKYNIELRGG